MTTRDCRVCGGDGWTDEPDQRRAERNPAHAHNTTCVACRGSGREPSPGWLRLRQHGVTALRRALRTGAGSGQPPYLGELTKEEILEWIQKYLDEEQIARLEEEIGS